MIQKKYLQNLTPMYGKISPSHEEENYLKSTYKKHIANIRLNSEKYISSKTGNKASISTFNIVLHVFKHSIGNLSHCYKANFQIIFIIIIIIKLETRN